MPVPDGFTTGTAPDNKKFLIPQYMVPALDQAFAAYRSKVDMSILNLQPGVSVCTCGADGADGASMLFFLIILYLSFAKVAINHILN